MRNQFRPEVAGLEYRLSLSAVGVATPVVHAVAPVSTSDAGHSSHVFTPDIKTGTYSGGGSSGGSDGSGGSTGGSGSTGG